MLNIYIYIPFFLIENQFWILVEKKYNNLENWVIFSYHAPFPDTEDASETDLAKHDEDDYVEIKEQ